MKSKSQIGVFLTELREVCNRHGIGLVGTDESEGIYSEILFVDLNDPASCGWRNIEKQFDNILYPHEWGMDFEHINYSVQGIADIKVKNDDES